LIGETLSHYRVTAKLGAGGMGEVYLAEDTKLGRQVALKVLPAELADDHARLRRLQREARALAALDHPNIVTVFSVEEANGVQFLTMAYVEGDSLDALTPRDGFSHERLLELAIPLADALRAAHEHGIVHRDLKPANIMIDKEGRLRVLDFGLARLERVVASDERTALATETMMTRAGTVLGTYPYMSPEQAQGQIVDARSDIFSLGIVLYEMATGRRPFAGETGMSLISSILKDTPRPVNEIKAGLPEELSRTIERCLEKEPGERFPSAGELRDRLRALRRRVRSGQAGVSASASRPRRLRFIAVAVVAAILAGTYAWIFVSKDGKPEAALSEPATPRIASLAVLPLRNSSGDPEQAYLVDGMTEALITDLSRIGELKVISRSSAMRYKGTDKPPSEIARELNVDALVEGSVLREGDRVGITAQLIEAATETNLWADRYEREISSILALQGEVAQAIAREIQVTLTPGEEALLARSLEVDPEAYEAYLKGMAQFYELTPAGLEAARHYFEQALEEDADYAPAHGGVALVWAGLQQMRLAPPAEAGPKAKAAAERALQIDNSVAGAHYALAIVRTWTDWDWEGAETSFRRAMELKPNWADVRAYYSHYLLITGHRAGAIRQMERALELDPYNTLVQALNSVVLVQTDRCEEALDFHRSTLEAVPNHPLALSGLVGAYYCLGMYEETYAAAVANWEGRGQPEAVAVLEGGYAEGGFAGAMSALAQWKQEHAGKARASHLGAGVNYAMAGESREALDQLELAFEERDPNVPYLGAWVEFRSLKNEPRFQDLLRRMNLPSA
jgi:serine/threonine protein kinase/Tfp pilus assembly protein PilF